MINLIQKRNALKVLDLFSGAGGFSEGFRQAGFDVIGGIDNWKPALKTHEMNGLGVGIEFDMRDLVVKGGYEIAQKKAREIVKKHGPVDVVIGSPPCTEFSYAKNGGKGDIEKGMLLVRSFLVFLAAIRPRFWLMENVKRLRSAIDKESENASAFQWKIPLERLHINEDISDWEWADYDNILIPKGEILYSSDFGSPQRRERYIAGHHIERRCNGITTPVKTLGECLNSLESQVKSKKNQITDPNYPSNRIKWSELRDHNYDTSIHPMYWEHMRHLKRRHIQYGKIAFPDSLDSPSRTIMATVNPSSREAIVLDTGERMEYQGKKRHIYRHITVREAACLQGFPINFQFFAKSLNMRYRLVGNAVPCQLAYWLACNILESFGNEGATPKSQEERYQETLRRRMCNNNEPIIEMPKELAEEIAAVGKSIYMSFRARENRHVRRKMLSSKIRNKSHVVIFENTIWSNKRRYGGDWKSCLQVGVGSKFIQVYLDERSVGKILAAADKYLKTSALHDVSTNTTAESNLETMKSRPSMKGIISDIVQEVKKGLPQLHPDWDEFPGYSIDKCAKYANLQSGPRKKLPSSSALQRMFTTDEPVIGEYIGPIDIIDGIDSIMLHHIMKPKNRWVLAAAVKVSRLTDLGKKVHVNKISDSALSEFSGEIPMVPLIASLVSVCVVKHMLDLESLSDSLVQESIRRACQMIDEWCGA